jgi:hypothetical protein
MAFYSSGSGQEPVAGCLTKVTKIDFHKMRGISLLAEALGVFRQDSGPRG